MNAILTVTVLLAVLCRVNSRREIIKNEDDLLSTCTGTCSTMPVLYDKHGCKKISGCRFNSRGWDRGFVRCDYCSCQCDEDRPDKDVLLERKMLSTNEDALYGTCTGTCSTKRGLIRTNFGGCQRVEDCRYAGFGWLRGFVDCDYCTCTCINKKASQSYRLTNVKYDMSEFSLVKGNPTALAETTLENDSGDYQTVTRILTYEDTQTTSLSTSHTLGYGLTIKVDSSVGLPGTVSLTTSVSHQLSYGFTHTAGTSNTTSRNDRIQASIKVPPKSSITATIIGHRMNVDIPYTADLVTTYADGSTSTKPITGIYTNVDTGNFRVKYAAAVGLPLKK